MDRWDQWAIIALAVKGVTEIILALVHKIRQNGSSGERDVDYWLRKLMTQESFRQWHNEHFKELHDDVRELMKRPGRR